MKTPASSSSFSLPAILALTLALHPAPPPARAAREVASQVEIEAKFVEISKRDLKELGFAWVRDFNTSISSRVFQPGGVSPQSLGTFPVNPPRGLPPTGDIQVLLSPGALGPAAGGSPLVTMSSAQRAVLEVLRDLQFNLEPQAADRGTIALNLVPTKTEFSPWSVDAFGTVAFGRVSGSEQTTREVKVNETRIVDLPTTVLVPFDNGNQIVNREETRLVPTEQTTQGTETSSERREINRLDDVAGGGGLRVNYLFNDRVGVNVRGEVLGGRDTLGVVTGSIFGEYPCCWPVTPTYSLGGGVLFPHAQVVMDVGLGLKKRVTPGFEMFSEMHLLTNFGRTTFGEFLVGGRFPLGRKPLPVDAEAGSGQTTVTGTGLQPRDRVPVLGRIPVIAHVFRQRGDQNEKRNLLIFVTPRIVRDAE